MFKTRQALIPYLLLVAAVAGGLIWHESENVPGLGRTVTTGTVQVGGPFVLTDQDGKPRTSSDFRGRYQLIYFGYTFCPDACPTELQVMAQAVEALGPAGAKVQPIFITIDPARDTARQLAGYVPLFDKRLVGLTGTPEQIAAVARAYKVYYAKAEPAGGDAKAYGMNHSSFVYLMNPTGRFLTVFPSDMDSDRMAAEIRKYMAAG